MNKSLRRLFYLAAFACASQLVHAQQNSAFAITGETKGNLNWTVIREVDLSSGSLIRNIYIPAAQKPLQVDASTGKNIIIPADIKSDKSTTCNCAAQSLSAASAYDAKQNRLYFTTLFGNDLQYIDLNQRDLKIYHVTTQAIKQFISQPGEGDNITRMAFASDGYGYALTNNGNHLIRFSTGKNVVIKDLGALKDGGKSDVSVHTQSASWGGDMVADDAGALYLFTIGGSIFKINPAAMKADFVGSIKGLPQPYSVNAAAVDKDGSIVISSSLDASNYYRVNLATLNAEAITRKDDQVFNASDFANGNFIACGKKTTEKIAVSAAIAANNLVSVYPNPVTNKTVQLYFNAALQGKHSIELTDLAGKNIAVVSIDGASAKQAEKIQLPAASAAGMYTVRVINSDNKMIFSQNVFVR